MDIELYPVKVSVRKGNMIIACYAIPQGRYFPLNPLNNYLIR